MPPEVPAKRLAIPATLSNATLVTLWSVAIAAVSFSLSSTLGIAISAAIIMVVGLRSQSGHMTLFCIGGLLLFDSGQSEVPKLAYTLLCFIFALVAVYRVRMIQESETRRIATNLLRLSFAYAAMIWAVFMPYTLFYLHNSFTSASHDAITQFLPCLGLAIGLGAGAVSTPREVTFVATIISVLAAIQYAVTWQSRRGLMADTYYFLGSRALVSFAFLFVLSIAIFSTRRFLAGTSAALGIAICTIASGNRSTVTMLIGLPILAFIALRRTRSSIRLLCSLASALVGLFLFIDVVLARLPFGSFALERLNSIIPLIVGSDTTDASAISRQGITRDALEMYSRHPLLGAGLGATKHVDSPALYLGIFGLAGTLIIAGYYLGVVSGLIRTMRPSNGLLALLLAWTAAVILSLVSSMPTADQGLSIALSMLAALGVSSRLHEENWPAC